MPETVRVLAAIRPLREAPDTPVFVNTNGKPLELRAMHHHWYPCLRVLGIRSRGIYACKDTYVSTVLPVKPIPWIEEQTGVVYATWKKHYGLWQPRRHDDRASKLLDRLAKGIKLCTADTISSKGPIVKKRADSMETAQNEECRGGESNPEGSAKKLGKSRRKTSRKGREGA